MARNNSGESSYFGMRDFPHGRAKHIVLYRLLQSQIARALRTSRRESNEYDFTYYDAFCGQGYFEMNMNERDENSPINESFGSPLVALEALFEFVRNNIINLGKRVRFVFNDKNEQVVSNLTEKITEWLQGYSSYTVDNNNF